MEQLHFEVFSRFRPAADANRLLYTPIADKLTFRQSRLYTADCEGDIDAAREYLRTVLVDTISQNVVEDGTPAFSGELFCISYGIKKGVLDLEKEAIMSNYAGRSGLAFTLHRLSISQKIYIYGAGDRATLAARFCRDVCNPAIHSWTIS